MCARCPWRTTLCILSLMKPRRERERETEREKKRERGLSWPLESRQPFLLALSSRLMPLAGVGLAELSTSCGHFTITKLTRVRWAAARHQGDQSVATTTSHTHTHTRAVTAMMTQRPLVSMATGCSLGNGRWNNTQTHMLA